MLSSTVSENMIKIFKFPFLNKICEIRKKPQGHGSIRSRGQIPVKVCVR